MAAKKPAAKKPAAAKPAGTALTKWDEALAARAQIAKKSEEAVTTGNFISLKAGVMSYQGNPMPNGEVSCIPLASILENNFFPGKYDPKKAQSPVCFAFGTSEEEMKPHEKSSKPQHAQCGVAGQKGCCPHNEWDSGEGGKGKACKNVRRIALITADSADSVEGIKEATVAYLKTPVTSVKAWAAFVNGCAAQEKPTLSYITTVKATPDAQTQFKVSFRATMEIRDGELIGALLDKATEVDKIIDFPYQASAANDEAPAKGGRAASAGKQKRKF